jgi:hypothetical protein
VEDLRYLSFKGQLLAIAAAWLVLLLLIVLDIQESLFPLAFLRLLLGLSFVLFFPGFLLQAAIFASRDDLDGIERVALSIGLSIALIPLLALVLDRLPWGIFLWPIVVGESVVMLLAGGVAYYRCRRLPPEARWYLTLPVSPVGVFLGLDRMTRWILGIAGVISSFILYFVAVKMGLNHDILKTLMFLKLAVAGHPPPLIWNNHTKHLMWLKRASIPPLGVSREVKTSLEKVQLYPGDCVVLYTDGILETRDSEKNVYGFQRLESLVKQGSSSATEVVRRIVQDFTSFVKDTSYQDDFTVLSFSIS